MRAEDSIELFMAHRQTSIFDDELALFIRFRFALVLDSRAASYRRVLVPPMSPPDPLSIVQQEIWRKCKF